METPILEEYPSNFDLQEFKNIPSFSGKLKYANERLKKLGSGSSRTVYQIDDKKALKIAKNKKGIAQNELEISLGNDYYLKNLVAEVFDHDENGLWLEMELASKVKPTTFKKITGVDIKDLSTYLVNKYNQNVKYGRKIFGMDDELEQKLDENEFVQSIYDLMMNYDMPAGDLGRLSSYGVINRNGQDDIVLVDYGLNEDIGKEHYFKLREQIRKMVDKQINK